MSHRSRTPNTPFIPPLNSPEGSPAPVIPPQSSTTPNYSPNPNPAYLYPTSPYANSPFIPPEMSPLATPGVIPGVIPSTSQSRGPRQGLSEDYTGYPTGSHPSSSPNSQQHPQMTPMSTGYGPIPPGTPWTQPTSAPAGYPAFNTTPWGPPPAPLPSPWGGPTPYGRAAPAPPFSPYSPYTPAGFAPGPLPGGQPAWGMPPPGVAPSMPPPGGYYSGGPPEWFQQPQQAAAAMHHGGFVPGPQPYRMGREPHAVAPDRMPPFTKGPHYVPTLDPMDAYILGADFKINPLLQPLPDDGSEQVHLKWNMMYPSSTIQRSSDSPSKSWLEGRDDPATFPRLISINIVSETIPWLFTIHARKASGVTCGEVIDGIAYNLAKFTSEAEYRSLSQQGRHEVFSAYRHNRSRAADVPGGTLGEGMKRLDYLGRRTMFGGIEVNNEVVKKINSNYMPATFVMKCAVSLPMTQKEMRQQEARMRSSSAHGHRSRANSTNARITVEPPSSAGDSDDSADNDHEHYR